jgi:hypothetical protein
LNVATYYSYLCLLSPATGVEVDRIVDVTSSRPFPGPHLS